MLMFFSSLLLSVKCLYPYPVFPNLSTENTVRFKLQSPSSLIEGNCHGQVPSVFPSSLLARKDTALSHSLIHFELFWWTITAPLKHWGSMASCKKVSGNGFIRNLIQNPFPEIVPYHSKLHWFATLPGIPDPLRVWSGLLSLRIPMAQNLKLFKCFIQTWIGV